MGAAVSAPREARDAAGPRLSRFRRAVIKVGSSLLVEEGHARDAWLASLADDMAGLARDGAQIVVVSSGAIALGRGRLGFPPGPLKLEEAQAAAAVGQIALAGLWAEALRAKGLVAAQVLLTLGDTEERRRYLNGRATLGQLLTRGVVPVVNENDTVATSEIRYGDNDRLAARVAAMVGADLLVLLSDIDGLYTAPPRTDPAARFIERVEAITPEVEAMAGAAGSELSRGGMRTKIDAARIATAAGTTMFIASGHGMHPLQAIEEGGRATVFPAHASPASARKAWIGGTLEPRGSLTVDDGAVRALAAGRSLLAAGVRHVEGSFSRGDAVCVREGRGREIARGLVAYDAAEMAAIAGRQSQEIESLLGYSGRSAVIHRDDLVMTGLEPGSSSSRP